MKGVRGLAGGFAKVVWVTTALLAVACGGRKEASVTTGGAVFGISRELIEARSDTLVDIGRIKAGEVVEYKAAIENRGNEPLVITGIETSCGCTSVEYERAPIEPGERGAFSFRFDSSGMWGMQMKLIEIRTSAGAAPYKIMVRAEVQGAQ